MAQLQIDPRRPPRLDSTQKRACRWLNCQTLPGNHQDFNARKKADNTNRWLNFPEAISGCRQLASCRCRCLENCKFVVDAPNSIISSGRGCTIYYCILGSGWVCRCSHENVASIPGCLGGFDDCKFSIFCNSWLGLVAPFVGCAIYSCVCCFFLNLAT